MIRSPIFHTALVVMLTIAITLAAAVALTLANFNRALSDAVASRFEVHAADLRDSLETGLSLGLALAEIDNADAFLAERLASDMGIVAIRVTDATGQSVFATARPGAVTEGEGVDTVAADLVNSFGRVAGSVEVRYAVGGTRSTVTVVGLVLLRIAGLLALLAGLIGAWGCFAALRRVPRSLERARGRFEGSVTGEASSEIDRLARDATATVDSVDRELAALEQALPAPPGRTGERR